MRMATLIENGLSAGLVSNIAILLFIVIMALYGREDESYFKHIMFTTLACFACTWTVLSLR